MKLLVNMLLLLAVTSVYAQHSLNGTIFNKENNSPLAYANVYFYELEKGTTSNENGEFVLENLPSGTHTLVVSIIGYETKSIIITLPTINTIDISLSPSVIEMEEVIISTPFHKLQRDNVMKVEQQRISNLKANGSINLADGITNIAGVASITTGIGIGKPVIRGLSSNRVLVYTQGIRLENQQYGAEHGLGVNDAGIESVEVIKGPASLLYGSDALGGVLYLNPERFAQAHTSSGDVSGNYFTNTSGYTTNAGYKASSERFKFLFRGSLTEHADYETQNYKVTNTRFREQDFKAGMGYQYKAFKTELRYNMNHSKLGIPEEIGEQSNNKSPLLPYQDITNHIFSSKSSVFFNNSRLDINLGYIYNDRKEFEEHHHEDDHEEDDHEEEDHEEDDEHEEDDALLDPALHMKLKTANYDIKYNLPKFGKIETIIGLQGMHQTNTNYGEELLIPDATTNDIGILTTSHIHFDKVDIQLGVRFDNRTLSFETLDKQYNSFNGAFGIKTNITNALVARLNLASGFRAPNLSELASDGTHEGTNRYEVGNINLKSERNFQTDLALEFQTEHLEVFANGFYNIINDYIFLSPNGTFIDGEPVFNYIQDDASLYGGEFGFHLHPHPLDWLHFESNFELVVGRQNNKENLPLIPANTLNNTVRVEFEKPWIKKGYAFVKLQSTFKQNNVNTFETTTDGFNLLSMGFGGNFKILDNDLLISISGTNLTNKQYINHLSRLKPDGIFNMGRNINLGFTYKL